MRRRADLRRWSVTHARGLHAAYRALEAVMAALNPLWRRVGYERLERPAALAERIVKSTLFGCRMCGQCVLSSTGMACPMNCPKTLRNGPCGGVRADGSCEIVAGTACVWLEAERGNRRLGRTGARLVRLEPLDNRRAGRSSWLEHVRRRAAGRMARAAGPAIAPAAPAREPGP